MFSMFSLIPSSFSLTLTFPSLSLHSIYSPERLTPPAHAVNRAVACEGLGCVLAGLYGTASGTASYTGNIILIGITKVNMSLWEFHCAVSFSLFVSLLCSVLVLSLIWSVCKSRFALVMVPCEPRCALDARERCMIWQFRKWKLCLLTMFKLRAVFTLSFLGTMLRDFSGHLGGWWEAIKADYTHKPGKDKGNV